MKRAILPGILFLSCISAAEAQENVQRHELPETVVKPGHLFPVFKSGQYAVVDYAFFNNGILLAAQKGDFSPKGALVLINEAGDTLAIGKPPALAESLYKDCAGNLILVADEALYVVYRVKDSLTFSEPMDRSWLPVLKSCRLRNYERVYFKTENFDDGGISYLYKSRGDSLTHLFYTSVDSDFTNLLHYQKQRYKTTVRQQPERFGFYTEEELEKLGSAYIRGDASNITVMRELQNGDLFLSQENLAITDYANHRVCYFTPVGEAIVNVPMEQRLTRPSRNSLLQDDVTGRFYIYLDKNGRNQQIQEVDLKAGAAIGPVFTFSMDFPERVSIHDGSIYFVQHDVGGGKVRQLYVQKW